MSDLHITHRLVRLAIALCAAFVLVVGHSAFVPTPAHAHDALIDSRPAEGEVLDAAPQELVLTFNAQIQDLGVAVVVTDPAGESLDTAEPVVSGPDVVLALDPLTDNGEYTVEWRVVSSDGHPISGSFAFRLDVEEAAGQTPTAPSPSPPQPSETEAASSPGEATASPGSAPSAPSPELSGSTGSESTGGEEGGSSLPIWIGLGVVIAGGAALAGVWARRRSS